MPKEGFAMTITTDQVRTLLDALGLPPEATDAVIAQITVTPQADVPAQTWTMCQGLVQGRACRRAARNGSAFCCEAHVRTPEQVAAGAAVAQEAQVTAQERVDAEAKAAERKAAQERAAKFRARKEFNREVLTPALKAAGLPASGAHWAAAKAAIEAGADVAGAVAAAKATQ
jgi:hypothetical protein